MKLVRTTFFSAIITFIRISSGFVAGKVVSLLTGPAGVALIGQFTNFISIILTFANGAINTGVVKYTAEYDGDEKQLKTLFSTSLKISIYCSAIVGLLLLITSSYLSEWMFNTSLYNNPIRVLGITIILYSLNTLLISILNGKQQIKTYTIVNTAGSIVGLIFTIVLVYLYKAEGALYALVLAQSIVFLITLTLILKSDWFSISYFNGAYDKKMGKKLFNYSLMTVVTALTGPVSQILLRKLVITNLGINSAGYWQGMIRISDGYLLLITTSLSTYYLPKLSSLNSDEELRKEIFQGYKLILPAVFVSCLLIYFLRNVIIRVLYTGEFESMQNLFAFQLLGDFFKMAAWLIGYLVVAKAMTKTYIITEIVFSFTYLFLSYFCIMIFKLQGITIAFAINYFIYFIVMIIIFRKLLFKCTNR